MIEIPGYRVLRPLGRGGMATVYLAVQESVQREVALKVMSMALRGDPEFGKRFLREARIAAGLRHRHVVQVHDVAVHGEHPVIAMEYMPGGPVLGRLRQRDPAFALRVVREIAGALDYAHGRGVIHRDIKPDNILLREDGSSALTDFGIARASDGTRMTRVGAIVGTPQYMSPEQARGQTVDGRADLYSLGIVLHELLVGQPPYQADDPLAVGIMHITAPLPRLPDPLDWLQPLLDRLLAKDPAERFQSGAEVAAAIAGLELAVAEGRSDAAGIDAGAVTPAVRGNSAGVDRDDWGEPTLGSLAEVASTPRPRRRPPRRRRPGIGWIAAAAVLLVAIAVAWSQQERLRALLPDTRLNALLQSAGEAARQGRLVASDGQDGARELYARVLAIDPDNQPARSGLASVGAALLERSRAALRADDLAAARRDLALARELSVPPQDVDALEAEVLARERSGVALDALLADARAALQAGRTGGEDGALALVRRAHALAPGNAVVTRLREEVLTSQLAEASTLLAAGDVAAASALVDAVAAEDPAHLGLPAARAAISERRQRDARTRSDAVAKADRLLAAGRLLPPGENARDAYLALAEVEPGSEESRAGLARVASALMAAAQRESADFRFERARALLAEAAAIAPAAPGIGAARQRLAEAEERHRRRFAGAAVDPARDARVTVLLREAQAALDAGRLMAPPGDSAYDKFRAARALDPANPAAIAGMEALPVHARRRFEEALAANRLQAAHDAVQALQSLAAADQALPGMRSRLARSLLGYAAERLGAGELARAATAIDQARELDPNHADLPAMQARLEQARGG